MIIRKGKAGYGHPYAKDFGETDSRSTEKNLKWNITQEQNCLWI